MKTVADIHAKIQIDKMVLKHDEHILSEVRSKLIQSIANELMKDPELPINTNQTIIEHRDMIEVQTDIYLINKQLYENISRVGGYRLLKAISNMNSYEVEALISKHEVKTIHNLPIYAGEKANQRPICGDKLGG